MLTSAFTFSLVVQVGLLGLARSLQKDLDRIADKADTSSPEGLHYILTGAKSFPLCSTHSRSMDPELHFAVNKYCVGVRYHLWG